MTDEKNRSDELDVRLAGANVMDLTNVSPAARHTALVSLITALESGLKIIEGHVIHKKPEPFPNAMAAVIRQQLTCIDMARKSRLIP